MLIILFFITSLGFLFWDTTKRKGKIFNFLIIALLFVLLSSFRNFDVGADTVNYLNGFHYIRNLRWSQLNLFNWEYGYVFLNKIISIFTMNDRIFLIILSNVILIPIFNKIYIFSKNPILSAIIFLIMGFYFNSMHLYRQYIAISILFFSFQSIVERKPLKFFLIIALASLFHRTALIFIIAYFVYKLKLTKVKVSFLFISSFLIYLLSGSIITFFNRFSRLSYQSSHAGGFLMLFFLWSVIIVVFSMKNNLQTEYDKLFLWLIVIGATIQPLSLYVSIWSRVVLYFSIYIIFVIPNAFEIFKYPLKGTTKFFVSLLSLAIFGIIFYLVGIPSYSF